MAALFFFFASTYFSPFLHWLYETEAEIGGAFMTPQNLLLLHLIFSKKQAPLLFCNGSHPFLCFNPCKKLQQVIAFTQLRFDSASCLCCNFCGCCHLLLYMQEKPPVLHTLKSSKHLCPLFFLRLQCSFPLQATSKISPSCLLPCLLY